MSRKLVEIITGISIDGAAHIGPGFYIAHFGGIIVGGGVTIGSNCAISQGVTIGLATGRQEGSPTL